MRAFISALKSEIEYYNTKLNPPPLTSLYLGGGTPSMLSRTLLSQLFDNLNQYFDLSQLQELTFEANPATFNLDKAIFFREIGITRISLGIQSFDNSVLKTLGREHTREQALATVPMLREAHIPEINIDLMFSIPGQSLASWRETLETTIALEPDHISAYNLNYEEDTEFIKKLTNGEYIDDPEVNATYFDLTHHLLTAAGYEHYETSNYAKPGKQSQHNKSYWQGADYLGIGPSAVSTINATRWKNLPDTAGYIRQINHIGHAQTEIENLSREDLRIERIALMLRTIEGIPHALLTHDEQKRAAEVIAEGLAKLQNHHNTTHFTLTRNGSLLVDAIVEHLL